MVILSNLIQDSKVYFPLLPESLLFPLVPLDAPDFFNDMSNFLPIEHEFPFTACFLLNCLVFMVYIFYQLYQTMNIMHKWNYTQKHTHSKLGSQ